MGNVFSVPITNRSPSSTKFDILTSTETWLSGRKHLAANEAGEKSSRGFKSHRLRQLGNGPPCVRSGFAQGAENRNSCKLHMCTLIANKNCRHKLCRQFFKSHSTYNVCYALVPVPVPDSAGEEPPPPQTRHAFLWSEIR